MGTRLRELAPVAEGARMQIHATKSSPLLAQDSGHGLAKAAVKGCVRREEAQIFVPVE